MKTFYNDRVMGVTFYNDTDKYACEWLENLMKAGRISPGPIFQNSIQEIKASDVEPYTRAHFFAGIGGWERALQLAGWPADRPVWTGSCPCQPFSVAGQRKGVKDKRHLWPEFYRLIGECRPPTIFGEQVASKDGREWLAGVFADLEELGYACAGADLCAAGVSAPHIRQRLYWVAYAEHPKRRPELQKDGDASGRDGFGRGSDTGGLGNADDTRPQGRDERGHGAGQRIAGAAGLGFWDEYDLIPCGDFTRRIEPGTFPLAHGVPARVGKLRAYGNAIVPQVAAEFIRSVMEIKSLNSLVK